jgi:hypothetical protein
MPKIFIRTSDLTDERPIIVASYKDDTMIADDAHGEGMTVMTVPDQLLGGPSPNSLGMASLVAGWRERAGTIPVKAEAKRRIEKSFSISDQLNVLHDMVDTILKYGVDTSKWPADMVQRKAAYDAGRKYIADVREKVRANQIMPRDPASDKVWPQRLTRKI